MQKVYSRINWENDPSTNTPINEDNLNKMDYALDKLDDRVIGLFGYEERAKKSEENAKNSMESAKASELSARNSMESAKSSEEKAKEYMEQAFSGTPDGYADLVEKVGLLDIAKSTDFTLYKSFAGGYRLKGLEGNTVQNKDILKYTGGAVSIESKKTFTYELPTPLVIDPNEMYTIVLENMNGEDEYSPTHTYANIVIFDSASKREDKSFIGTNAIKTYLEDLENITKIQITATTTALTFTSIRIEHDASPDYPQPLNHYGDCVEMIQGYRHVNTGEIVTSTAYLTNKNEIPCKSGDIIKIKCDDVVGSIVAFYYNSTTFVSYIAQYDTSSAEFTVPSGCDRFAYYIGYGATVTPQTVGKIQLTVNGKYLGCIRGHGKNFLKLDCTTTEKSGVSFTVNNDNSVTVNGTNTSSNNVWFRLNTSLPLKAGTYILNKNTSKDAWLYIHGMTTSWKEEETFTLAEDKLIDLSIVVPQNTTVSNVTIYPMIRKADVTDDTYEPYKETLAWYYTEQPPRLGDYMFKDSDGLFKIERNVAESVLNGDEYIQVNSYYPNTFAIGINGQKLGGEISCTHYVGTKNVGDFGNRDLIVYLGSGGLALKNSAYSTVDEVKSALSENPVTIMYELSTPTIEVLDAQSQINLNSIETFDGVTCLECDSRVKPLGIKGEYGTSQVGAYTLQALNKTDSNAIKIEDAINTMLLITP